MKPSRPMSKFGIDKIDKAIGKITEYYSTQKESIPYRVNPNDPRHVKMYYRGCEDNTYIPVLLFIYRYGPDESSWGPVMVYYNPRYHDSIWLHGFLRMRPNPGSGIRDEYVYSLWKGLHVSDPDFGGILGYNEKAAVDFISLASQVGNKDKLESLVMALILGRLNQAEMWLNIDSAKVFNEDYRNKPRRQFEITTIDMISYPATIFLKKFMQLLIRCAKENSGQLISHRFRIPPWTIGRE